MNDARLRRVLRAEGLVARGIPALVASESNEVWRVDHLYVRICWRGDLERLIREASVAALLPPEVGYPEVVATGCDDEYSWMVTREVEGVPVSEMITSFDSDARSRVGERLGELLQIVHQQPVPDGIDLRAGEDVVGEDRYPLPVPRARRLLRDLMSAGLVDLALGDAVSARLDDLELLDPFASPGVLVHGDAGVENLLWRDGDVVGLLDFEWVRSGEGWVDVLPLLTGGDVDVARGVQAAYPEPFASPDASSRVCLIELVNALRTLAIWPGPENTELLRGIVQSR